MKRDFLQFGRTRKVTRLNFVSESFDRLFNRKMATGRNNGNIFILFA